MKIKKSKRHALSNRTLYLMLNLAKDFTEATLILKTYFIKWSDKTYTAENDELPMKPNYEQFRVMVNRKLKQVYILHDEVDPRHIKLWVEGGELAIIDYKEDLAHRMARELYNAVGPYGCGDHFQDALERNMIQIWDTTSNEEDIYGRKATSYLYQGREVRRQQYNDQEE